MDTEREKVTKASLAKNSLKGGGKHIEGGKKQPLAFTLPGKDVGSYLVKNGGTKGGACEKKGEAGGIEKRRRKESTTFASSKRGR